MVQTFGEFAFSSVIDAIASTLNKNSYPPGTPSSFPSLTHGRLMQGDATVRLALSDSAFSMPQPGEIWQLCRSVQSPLPLSEEEQRSQYPNAVLRFLAGNTSPRYVMIVTEPESTDDEWQTVSVMMLSVKTEYQSAVDLVIPAELSGVEYDLLAETWHIQRGLVCNLASTQGQRLSRQIYDLLMSVGDRHYNLIDQAPTLAELQSAGLQVGLMPADDPRIQQFHQQEREWGSVLHQPVAAYRAVCKSMQIAARALEDARLTFYEMALQPEEPISELVDASPAIAQTPTHLSDWFEHRFSVEWEAIAPQKTTSNPASTEIETIETLILQLDTASNPAKRRQIASSLDDLEISHSTIVQALAQLVQTTTDDETLWVAVESLWQLAPDHLAAGVRRIKQLALGPQSVGQPIALAIALLRRAKLQVAIQLRVVAEAQPLPPDVTLTIHNASGDVLQQATDQQSNPDLLLLHSGLVGEAFSVSITRGDARIVEHFVI